MGLSLESDTISILAAKVPDAPINLSNSPEITTGFTQGTKYCYFLTQGAK